jgi:bifunctional NMN adenylyltransferase/nudix hydrolase
MIKIAVAIARFQVPDLTDGHKALLKKCYESAHTLVLLGCSELDGKTAENPLLFLQRKAAVERAINYMNLTASNFTILPLFNAKSNEAWSKQVDDMIYGLWPDAEATIWAGRDSIVPACYSGRASLEHFDAVITPSGTEVRSSIRPATDREFVRGQTFALQFQFPHAYQCVDIGVIKGDSVLLIQRGDTGSWCLPGGFVDPTDESLEQAARRELSEETKLSCEGTPEYVTSALISDWRYRGRDRIMSALFAIPYSFGEVFATKEAPNHVWFPLNGDMSFISSSHTPFVAALKKRFATRALPRIEAEQETV